MKDPRVIGRDELKAIRGMMSEYTDDVVIEELLNYIDLLHELVNPIQTAFLEREQERMGWRSPTS